jgi:hypothetical protein
MTTYAILPSLPWPTQVIPALVGIGVLMRIAYEWIGTYRLDRSWSQTTRYGILIAGGVLWAPVFFSAG